MEKNGKAIDLDEIEGNENNIMKYSNDILDKLVYGLVKVYRRPKLSGGFQHFITISRDKNWHYRRP